MNKKLTLLTFLALFPLLFSFSFGATPTIPTNVIYYIPFNITNSQSIGTGSNFQQMITFNAFAYSSLLNQNLSNIEFFYNNGTIIPSWLQGNVLNEQQQTLLNTSSNIIFWLNISNGIQPNSLININIGITQINNNLLNNKTTGEAPQLSLYTAYPSTPVWTKTLLGLGNGLGGITSATFNGTQNINGQEATVIYTDNSQLLNVPSTENVFKMWWRSSNVLAPGIPSNVVYGESLNGYNWTMAPGNTVLNCESGTLRYGNSISMCMQPFVMESSNTYYLYVDAYNASASYLTCLENVYSSSNGISWTLAGANELSVCNKPNWVTSGILGNRYVWQNTSTGTWYQLQEASGAHGWQIGLWTSSNAIGPWTEYGTTPVIGPAPVGENITIGGPEMHFINGKYYVWAQCNIGKTGSDPGSSTDICLAYTSNVESTWTLSPYNPVFYRSAWWENASGSNSQVADPSIVQLPNGTTYMFYETVYSQPIPQMAVAKSNMNLAEIANVIASPVCLGIYCYGNSTIKGYAKFDNGKNIFTNYENFIGNTLWSGLSAGVPNSLVTQNDGLSLGTNISSFGYSLSTNWDLTAPQVFEGLITVNKGSSLNYQEGIYIDGATDTSTTLTGSTCGLSWYITRRSITGNFFQMLQCSTVLASSGATGTYPYTSIESFAQNTTGLSIYDGGSTLTNSITNNLQSGYAGLDLVFASSPGANSTYVQYLRTRTYPPKNVMPSVSIMTLAIPVINPNICNSIITTQFTSGLAGLITIIQVIFLIFGIILILNQFGFGGILNKNEPMSKKRIIASLAILAIGIFIILTLLVAVGIGISVIC